MTSCMKNGWCHDSLSQIALYRNMYLTYFIMNKFSVITIFVLMSLTGFTQATISSTDGTFRLNRNSSDDKVSLKRGSFVGEHPLGDSVAYALNKFEYAAVYYTKSDGAYAIEKETIVKPAIYKKIKSLDKYFIKETTNKKMPIAEAKRRELTILIIGAKLYKFDTSVIETDLKKLKDNLIVEDYLRKLKFNE